MTDEKEHDSALTASSPVAVFCDFDGTISIQDVGNRLFHHFSDGKSDDPVAKWRSDQIDSRQCLIDEAALREHTALAFEFHLVKRPQMETRIRLPGDQAIGSLTPLELVDLYWRASHTESEDHEALTELAAQVIRQVHNP